MIINMCVPSVWGGGCHNVHICDFTSLGYGFLGFMYSYDWCDEAMRTLFQCDLWEKQVRKQVFNTCRSSSFRFILYLSTIRMILMRSTWTQVEWCNPSKHISFRYFNVFIAVSCLEVFRKGVLYVLAVSESAK